MIKIIIIVLTLVYCASADTSYVLKEPIDTYDAFDCNETRTTEFCSAQVLPQPAVCMRIKYTGKEIEEWRPPTVYYTYQCLPYRELFQYIKNIEVTYNAWIYNYTFFAMDSNSFADDDVCEKDSDCRKTECCASRVTTFLHSATYGN